MKNMTIKKFHEGLKNRDVSAYDSVVSYFDEIEKHDGTIGAYLDLYKDEALKEARAVDVGITEGRGLGRLSGVSVAVKDNILVAGKRTTAASKILKDYIAGYNATVIEKLRAEGAIILGKTNMDELAMGSSTENSTFKLTRNPRDPERVPGGSSGGSAASVAGNMSMVSIGSDTGGSVRQPAGFCGAVGLKPTYGAVSRYGLIAMASSLDQIGPITKTVEDAGLVYDIMRGGDKYDATSFDGKYGDGLLNPNFKKISEMTVGIPEEYFAEGLESHVEEAVNSVIDDLKEKGVKFKKINLPHTKYALSVYYIIMPAEVSTNLARLDGIRYGTRGSSDTLLDLYHENKGEGFGPEAKRRIILGTFVLSSGYYDAYYGKAQKVRALIKKDFDDAFDSGIDAIISPTTPTTAFKIGEKSSDPLQMYLSDIFTIPVNMAGLPAISIPVKGVEGLPIGFQLIGRKWREADILGLGRLYEEK